MTDKLIKTLHVFNDKYKDITGMAKSYHGSGQIAIWRVLWLDWDWGWGFPTNIVHQEGWSAMIVSSQGGHKSAEL